MIAARRKRLRSLPTMNPGKMTAALVGAAVLNPLSN
jgi:hypothetical protein